MLSQNRIGPLLFVLLAVGASCAKKQHHPDQESMTPQQSLAAIKLTEEFKVELFASEPQVVDPVEMVWDENGKIYVAEMSDYPDDPPPGKPALSKIRVLEDTDHDGKIDKSYIFADHILEISSMLPYKGGLIVGAAPDILYLKDTDGDGKADKREVLFTGWPMVNPEGRITNLRYGIDNWIYAANNGADAKVTVPGKQGEPLLLRGADFRFRPDTGQFERASGPAQFGLTMDDWGNRFITQNTVHVRNAIVPAQYLSRAPALEIGAVSFDISDHGKGTSAMYPLTKPQAWRVARTDIRQKRYNETNPGRVELLEGFFTAASGGTIYTGDVFPEEYNNNLFTGDVSANLVHRDIITPDGVTFKASRSKDKTEFLASTDIWFRPCHFANAPDGLLYITDMYREFIETPESIPEELRKDMDFWSGMDKGRIYRLVPNNPRKKRTLDVKLGSASAAELVKTLEETNGWHRNTAQRLLVERQDKSVVPALVQMAAKSAFPQARLHALYVLEGLKALEPAQIETALRDANLYVREHALRLSEPFLAANPALQQAVLKSAADKEVRVLHQLAYTLGDVPGPAAKQALARLANAHATDNWFRIAILTSAANAPADFMETMMSTGKDWQVPAFVQQFGSMIGARQNPAEIGKLLALTSRLKNPESAFAGLARGLELASGKRLDVPGAEAVFTRVLNQPEPKLEAAAWRAARFFNLPAILKKATVDAVNPSLSQAKRAAAVRALASAEYSVASPLIEKVFATQPPDPGLQTAAMETLGLFPELDAAKQITKHWKESGPAARNKAVAGLLSRRDSAPVLLDAIDKGEVDASAIEVGARARLLESNDAPIAARAKKLFQAAAGDRAKVVAQFTDVVNLNGDPVKGKPLFEENCSRCHSPRKAGGRVGPDLSGVNNKSKRELLESILNPSAAIDPRFTNYMVTTKDGRVFDGIIANETPGAITLRGGSDDGDATILRKNIAEVRASAISLMPDELEKQLGKQGLADVIAYLRAGL